MRAVLSPTVRLLLAGAVLLAATGLLTSPARDAASAAAVQLAPARIEGVRRGFLARVGRAPDALELAALVEAEMDDELLYRAALASGLDRDDAVVQRRVLGNLAFVDGAGDEGRGGGLALGLLARDVVVQRRLSARMRALLEHDALRAEPSDAELEQALARNEERFALPPRVRVTHVLLRDAGASEEARRRAESALAALRTGARHADAASLALDAALPGATVLPLQSERDLARQLGAQFAHASFAAPVGEWTGPVASPFGLHLVRVDERERARLPALATVRNQVRELVRRERAGQAVRRALVSLRRTRAAETASAAGDAG